MQVLFLKIAPSTWKLIIANNIISSFRLFMKKALNIIEKSLLCSKIFYDIPAIRLAHVERTLGFGVLPFSFVNKFQ